MKPYFIYLFYYFLIYLFNIITINFTITARKKGGKTVKKQTNKKSEVRKFQQINNNWKNK